MYLRRLDIVGFKSFTERTQVSFGPGISAVVGPNGCGKSNIIDAIRWVMGEQTARLLRARNMEDLLFNGSQGRPAAGVAEVTLTLAGSPDEARAEISVTRRLYRGGDAEYLINRVPARLKDVARFFIEAGLGTRSYAIIEQEKVGRLVDAPPEERRLLIDVAAGVTYFKERKRESERRLESTLQNLATVSAVTEENAKRHASVARAAAKAVRWRDLRAELRSLELAASARRFLDLSSRRAALAARAGEARQAQAALEASHAATELAIDAARLAEAEAADAQERAAAEWHRRQGALADLEGRTGRLAAESADAAERLERAGADLAAIDGEKAAHEAERASLEARVAELAAEFARAERDCDRLDEEYRLARLEGDRTTARRQDLGRRLAAARDDRQRRAERLAGLEATAEILAGNLKTRRLESNRFRADIEEAEKTVASRERRHEALQGELSGLKNELESARSERAARRQDLDKAMAALSEADRLVASLSARAQTLEELRGQGFGWYAEGVRTLMRDPEAGGVISPVAEALKVPDGYERAAEAFLGERLGWLLVESRQAGLEALRLARRKGLGRCGFISQGALPSQGGAPDLAGALLGPVELSDDLPDTAPENRAVLTRQGDYVGTLFMAGGGAAADAQGLGTGPGTGPAKPGPPPAKPGAPAGKKPSPKPAASPPGQSAAAEGPGLLARLKEAETVSRQLAEAEAALAGADSLAKAARSALTGAEGSLAASEGRRTALEADLNEAYSKLMVARSEAKNLAIRRDSTAGEIARVEADIAKNDADRRHASEGRKAVADEVAALESQHHEAVRENEARAAALEDIRERSRQAASAADSLTERLDSAKRELTRVADWLGGIGTRRSGLEAQKAGQEARLARLAAERSSLAEAMEGLPAQVAEAEALAASLRSAAAERREAAAALEEEARSARRARDEAAATLKEIDSSLMETRFELSRLNGDLLKDWRVVLAGPKDDPDEELDDAMNERPGGGPDKEPDEGPDKEPCDGPTDGPGDGPGEGSGEAAGGGSPSGPSGADGEAGGAPLDPEAPKDPKGPDGPDAPKAPDGTDGTAAQAAPDPDSESGPAGEAAGDGTEGKNGGDGKDRPVGGGPRQPPEGPDGAEAAPAAAPEPPPERLDPFDLAEAPLPPDAEAAMGRIRGRLAAMGEINHTAIEEEAELSLQLAEQRLRHDDLVKGVKDLRDSIARINLTCQKRFEETFEEADGKFREIFPILFEGGEGWLALTDESNPVESGVEIHVHPPGKKIMVMRSLSGGEKTLTSLCLIFALYLIKPSPFCLLDEADAPLDEANIDRFNRLLRNLSESSQIIMVTHNKRTMQISDILYGVTMETPGVSRLVSVNLAEAEVLTND